MQITVAIVRYKALERARVVRAHQPYKELCTLIEHKMKDPRSAALAVPFRASSYASAASPQGVCSTFLGERLSVGDSAPIYVTKNPEFRLPGAHGYPETLELKKREKGSILCSCSRLQWATPQAVPAFIPPSCALWLRSTALATSACALGNIIFVPRPQRRRSPR